MKGMIQIERPVPTFQDITLGFYYDPAHGMITGGRAICDRGKIFVTGGSISLEKVEIDSVFFGRTGEGGKHVIYRGTRVGPRFPEKEIILGVTYRYEGNSFEVDLNHDLEKCQIYATINTEIKDLGAYNANLADIRKMSRESLKEGIGRFRVV